MKKSLMLLVLLCSVLTLSACQNASQDDEIAAIVNGSEITMEAFNERFDYNLAMISAYGTVVDAEMEKELRASVLDTMIRNELLIQEANSDDYTVTDDEVDELYQNYVLQYETEENLVEAIENSGQTLESFKNDLKTQLELDYYLTTYITEHDLYSQLMVSEEEIEDAFVQYSLQSAQEDLKLEDVYDQIQASLEQEKQIAVIRDITDMLMENSDIEYIYQTE